MNRAARRSRQGRAATASARPWHGRRGPVVLGPTEDRVARYLAHMTRNGRVTLRALDLAGRLGIERSEVYRITRRLRVLGLFGIEDDRGGTRGGRRYWRTAIEHDGQDLDPVRHRTAWARVVASTVSAAGRAFHAARSAITYGSRPRGDTRPATLAPVRFGPVSRPPDTGPPGRSFAELMRAAGLGGLMDEWRVGA